MTWAGTVEALSVAFDGLVAYARRGGSEGTRIVPNLAVSLPTDTAGDTRYAFRLRPGVRYSDGTPVRASDFRRAFREAVPVEAPAPAPFVGGDACMARPRNCDLSRGIRTDDETGTIVFHLRRAQPASEFLRNLTQLWPIPQGTPDRDQETRPIPSTGPYTIESYVPRRALTLVRNPHFRVWSRVARPDGFPDEIEVRLDGSAIGVAAIERGLDLAFAPTERPQEVRALAAFRARHASQVHVGLGQHTVLLFLNSAHPPFDDVRVRKALNYAIDRGAISQAYGGFDFALPTCQPRPPGTVGFRRYCPYTVAPSPTGEWKAPDLARARKLVAASGTLGMRVTVWTFETQGGGLLWENAVTGAVRALEQLGYRPSIGRARDLNDWAARVGDRKTSGVQAGVIGWYGIPRAASSVLTGFRCVGADPPNYSFFCDRRIDTLITRALEVQGSDPDAAVTLWADIERDIVGLAPWVPLFTPGHALLVSERVGNVQRNPELGVLTDQIWVR